MSSIINWEELMKLGRPAMPPRKKSEMPEENMWDKEAEKYNLMTLMERWGTLNQINCIPIAAEDVVLDVCCGPGRIAKEVAKIAKKVIAVDSSEKMMEKCKENIEMEGVADKVETILLNWNEAEPGKNVPMADVVIASRSMGLRDIAKLSSFARKYAAIIGWANGPSIPETRNKLFIGAVDGETPRIPMQKGRRELSYNVQYNIVYDMGYEPNINIVRDGWGKHFAAKDEAYADLIRQAHDPNAVNMDIFKENVDKYLTESASGGYDFWMETRTFVLWWEVNPKQF